MRIGMMADVYQTHVSGVTNSIALLKRWMEKEGHEVYVFTFGDGAVVDTEKHIIRAPGVPLVDTGIYLNLRYNRSARRLLYSMDIVHVHHPFLSGSLAMRYCVPRNIPVVFTNHTRYDLYAQAYIPMLPEQIGDAALKAYLTPFFKACDLVIVPTPSMRAVLEGQCGAACPIEVIPNGLELTPFRTLPAPIDRSQFGFTNTDVVAIYVGRLALEKNLAMLVRAFYGAASAFGNIRLLIVGDGPDRENLEEQVKHLRMSAKVHFTGMVDYHAVPAYMAAGDFFVITSVSETFGLSTVEAMAAGLPTLGVEAPGTVDIIQDGETGLISPDDMAVFTAKLILLSTDQALRKRMGLKARLAAEKYDIQATAVTVLQHYRRLVEEAKRRKLNPRHRLIKLMDNFV
ncbi:MAG: hypothetical protein A2136_01775 [Chloroflexi bacterium RBG_16_54_11]|nr:MAG: hypothetical protein A2136_01775 [Chloroflexi bacterium RBG_16_54_11]